MKSKGIRTVVYLQEGEKLVIVKQASMYKLGYPLEDIVCGETIAEAASEVWDEISQSWMI